MLLMLDVDKDLASNLTPTICHNASQTLSSLKRCESIQIQFYYINFYLYGKLWVECNIACCLFLLSLNYIGRVCKLFNTNFIHGTGSRKIKSDKIILNLRIYQLYVCWMAFSLEFISEAIQSDFLFVCLLMEQCQFSIHCLLTVEHSRFVRSKLIHCVISHRCERFYNFKISKNVHLVFYIRFVFARARMCVCVCVCVFFVSLKKLMWWRMIETKRLIVVSAS